MPIARAAAAADLYRFCRNAFNLSAADSISPHIVESVYAFGIDIINALCIDLCMSNDFDVKSLRERMGVSQGELAKRFGVNQATISRWEKFGLPDSGPARLVFLALAEQPTEAHAS